MREKFDYTTVAQRYTARFPLLSYVYIQTSFWIVANLLLVIMMNLQFRIFGQSFNIELAERTQPFYLVAFLLGGVYGLSLGVTGYYLDKSVMRQQSLGKVILFKSLISLAVLFLLLLMMRYFLYDHVIVPRLNMQPGSLTNKAWGYAANLLVLYYFVMTLVISFINQVNKKYGPGVLLPLLFGKYRNPVEEDRIFLFMDLKSSTAIAEQLGHLRYSAFIRDCFADINDVLLAFRAQVYQYVGDEIVITWPESEGLKNQACIRFYFACKYQFSRRTDYYLSAYGALPHFKAGLHTGKVTTVEIGVIKRDIAYHGDTLNTASRIQSVCNEYQKDFLVSAHLVHKLKTDDHIHLTSMGKILLRGKKDAIELISVESGSWAKDEPLNKAT
jgi:adenylate cyclase